MNEYELGKEMALRDMQLQNVITRLQKIEEFLFSDNNSEIDEQTQMGNKEEQSHR
jgi:hypothetical protein